MASKPDNRKGIFSLFPEKFRKARSRAHRKNDEYMILGPEEGERLNQQHYLLRNIFHGNFNSPLESELQRGIKVADIGCGYGNWTLDMAQDFPASTFIGTDLVESVLPTEGIPPNCSFVQADTLTGLPFPDGTFDYVFQRLVVLSYTEADWVKGVAELIRVTKPGGYVELFEADSMIQRAPESYQKYENACKYKLRFAYSRWG
ncbi:S-adenosyl-L-methionine-dependent methyltransferase [Endogone sp. FLAS-F59071]|nr:S-adenosyl-L-methionine-dependent methyltransferase [Endogone sp. FLAS-F59071]|eukprot:RUS15493.1 S-adenosyl-L-methionine-dependent methyltransferase [Endogone sp. FLAS-F59071]